MEILKRLQNLLLLNRRKNNEKMKTISNEAKKIWKRVTNEEAQSTVGRAGWKYCPKSEWKENVRSPKTETKEKKKEEE